MLNENRLILLVISSQTAFLPIISIERWAKNMIKQSIKEVVYKTSVWERKTSLFIKKCKLNQKDTVFLHMKLTVLTKVIIFSVIARKLTIPIIFNGAVYDYNFS